MGKWGSEKLENVFNFAYRLSGEPRVSIPVDPTPLCCLNNDFSLGFLSVHFHVPSLCNLFPSIQFLYYMQLCQWMASSCCSLCKRLDHFSFCPLPGYHLLHLRHISHGERILQPSKDWFDAFHVLLEHIDISIADTESYSTYRSSD